MQVFFSFSDHRGYDPTQKQGSLLYVITVKLVYKDHPGGQQNVVLIHRWSLYTGSITWKVHHWGPVKSGLCKQVVFIYRWSLEQV